MSQGLPLFLSTLLPRLPSLSLPHPARGREGWWGRWWPFWSARYAQGLFPGPAYLEHGTSALENAWHGGCGVRVTMSFFRVSLCPFVNFCASVLVFQCPSIRFHVLTLISAFQRTCSRIARTLIPLPRPPRNPHLEPTNEAEPLPRHANSKIPKSKAQIADPRRGGHAGEGQAASEPGAGCCS